VPDARAETRRRASAGRACAARLGLGTVQLGLRYGVAHAGPRPTRAAALEVIDRAASLGVGMLDTAPRYGAAEDVVGASARRAELRVVTKTAPEAPGGAPGEAPAEALERGLDRSLARLGLDRVHGLLEHDAAKLLGPGADERWRAMERLRSDGRVARIGASVYAPEEVFALLERYPLEIVQAPLNALDLRMRTSGALARLAERGVEVHLRSVLLQGALPARPDALALNPALSRAVGAFRARCAAGGLAPLEAALGLALEAAPDAVVVVGAQSAEQLDELADAGARALARGGALDLLAGCASNDPEVHDPRRWRVLA